MLWFYTPLQAESFFSYVCGLPAPEHAENPLRFKFRWYFEINFETFSNECMTSKFPFRWYQYFCLVWFLTQSALLTKDHLYFKQHQTPGPCTSSPYSISNFTWLFINLFYEIRIDITLVLSMIIQFKSFLLSTHSSWLFSQPIRDRNSEIHAV